MSDVPEYVKCIRKDGDDRFTMCGKREMSWKFQSISHVLHSSASGERLIPCRLCIQEWDKNQLNEGESNE